MMNNRSLKTNALLNAIRTFMSMIFPLITFPYVSRILQVENMGKVNFSASIVSYFTLLAGLGISTYAIREGSRLRDNEMELKNFGNQIFTINLLSTAVAYILLAIVLFFVPSIHTYVLLIIVQSVNIIGTTLGVEWINIIYENYIYIAIRSFLVQFVSMIALFVLVHNTNDYVVYAAIMVFSMTAANIFNFIYVNKKSKIRITSNLRLNIHLKPIMVIFAMSVATTIYVNSDSTMLGFMSGDYYVGLYAIAAKIYSILKSLIAAFILVALPRLSNYIATGKIEQYNRKANDILNLCILLLLPTVVGVFMTSNEIINLFAGETYLDAVPALNILSISLIFSIFAVYFTHVVLLPMKKEKIIMYATIFSAVVNLLLNTIFIPLFNHIGAAITTAISECIVMIWQMYYVTDMIRMNIAKKDIVGILLGCLSIICICILVDKFSFTENIKLIIKISGSVVSYYCILISTKNSTILKHRKRLS